MIDISRESSSRLFSEKNDNINFRVSASNSFSSFITLKFCFKHLRVFSLNTNILRENGSSQLSTLIIDIPGDI